MLWGSLGVSLLVLVAAVFIVPALSLRDGILAIVVGGLIGNTMLGLAGLIGAQARVPAMVLLRAPLGRRGSYAPTALNVLQCLGWATFELIIIGKAAGALSDEVFGFEATWLWTIVFGAIAGILALLGPVGVVRRFLRRFGFWAVVASLGYLTWWALDEAPLGDLWSQPGQGGQTFLGGVDLVIAITVSWVPLAADYTRFCRSRSAAFWGTGVGYLLAGTWLFLLGAVLVLPPHELTEATELPSAVAAGGLAAALALLALTLDEADEAFANVYSAGVSLQNVISRVPQRTLLVLSCVLATVGALTIELRNYETFLLLLGSFFVPLFGVLLADWLLAGRRYGEADIFGAPALRPLQIAAWLVGFGLYHWLHDPPLGPGWWVDVVELTDPPGWGIGASLPSFAAAFALAALAALRYRRPSLAAARA
jgi:NCS1 family nucleobase:cation symporter-1